MCGNGQFGCVNQHHVRWGTHVENCSDRTRHGTEVRGARNGQAKLTEDEARAILASSDSQNVIAARYGISQQHVSEIKRHIKWGHIK